MALKKFKPVTPGTRFRSDYRASDAVTRKGPEKSLTEPLKRSGWPQPPWPDHRAAGGEVATSAATARWISSGTSTASKGRIAEIEYDPNRSALIALVHYEDGEKRYILYVSGMGVGDVDLVGSRRGHPAGQHAAPRTGSPSAPPCTMWK